MCTSFLRTVGLSLLHSCVESCGMVRSGGTAATRRPCVPGSFENLPMGAPATGLSSPLYLPPASRPPAANLAPRLAYSHVRSRAVGSASPRTQAQGAAAPAAQDGVVARGDLFTAVSDRARRILLLARPACCIPPLSALCITDHSQIRRLGCIHRIH